VSTHTIQLPPEVQDYLLRTTVRESVALAQVRKATAGLPGARMQTSPEQAQLLGLLVELLGVHRALEIGVYTGYSAVAVAEALPADGRLVACELDREYARVAGDHLAHAALSERVDLRVGPALETLAALPSEPGFVAFDLAYIDADKTNYDAYYERCLELVRPGGLIALDNMLWGGSVADPSDQQDSTQAIRALNQKVGTDERVTVSLVPIGDGLLLARRRK
jgi:predicted O-methyltransferase YrrM